MAKPQILRAIRIDYSDGREAEVLGPGREDDLEEMLLEAVQSTLPEEEKGKAQNIVENSLNRLAKGGFIVGFGDEDVDEENHPDPDIRANARSVGQGRAIVQGTSRMRPLARSEEATEVQKTTTQVTNSPPERTTTAPVGTAPAGPPAPPPGPPQPPPGA